ncbi:MAG: S8 family serine peptidase [Bacteroidota bacterium]|nr:S8 family serine peptidase [Bacteroidota bacterium]
MKYAILTVFFIIALFSFNVKSFSQEKFIYLHNEKTFLKESSNNKLLVKFRKDLPSSKKESILREIDAKEILQKEKLEKSDNFEIELQEGNKKALYKDKLAKNKDVLFVSEYYKMKENEILFSGIIAVSLKDLNEVENFYRLVESSDLKIIKRNEVRNKVFYLSSKIKNQDIDIIDTANELFESGLFGYSYPDIIFKYDTYSLPSDTYINDQWAIPKIKLDEAWTNTTGNSNIKIAILDCGVNYMHNDLLPNWQSFGYDAMDVVTIYDEDGNPTGTISGNNDFKGANDVGDNHGTICAGVAVAKGNNGIGIAGAAYNCSFNSIRVYKGTTWASGIETANAIDYAVFYLNSDILSISWGNKTFYDPDIKAAIDNAYTNGRNGLGTVIVAAAGNSITGDPSLNISYPANASNVIAVGNSTATDNRATTSCYQNGSIDFVAPGENIKTTLPGSLYTTESGTSLSCPLVAGVAGLLLSKDPTLTNYRIREILSRTCDKPHSGFIYQYSTAKAYGSWNQEMGYGRINALSAMQMVANNPVSGEIRPSDGIDLDYFGCDVQLYKDWLICGAWGANKVYIFRNENNVWVLKQTLPPQGGGNVGFGYKISIYDDQLSVNSRYKNYVAPYNQFGSVSIYRLINGNWTFSQEIVAPSGCKNFGSDLSIYNNYLVVTNGSDGVVDGTYMYKRVNDQFILQSKISDVNYPNASFGKRVSLSGRYLAVRTEGGGGSSTLFECQNNSWVPVKYLNTSLIELNGNMLVSIEGGGKIYIRKKDNNGNWNLIQTISVNYPNMTNGYVNKLAVFGNSILAGAGTSNASTSDRKGHVALFTTNYENWDHYASEYRGAPNSSENDFFGYSIALSEYFEVVGSPFKKGTSLKGSIYTRPNNSFIGFHAINEANFTCQEGVHEFKAGSVEIGGLNLTYEVKSGANITYQGNSIKLSNGFRANNGSKFSARTFQTEPILKSAKIDTVQGLPKIEYRKICSNLVSLDIKSIDKIIERKVSVYPNPVKEVLHVDFEGVSIREINLINNIGVELQKFKEPLNNFAIKMNELPNGLYIVKIIYTDNTSENFKIVK